MARDPAVLDEDFRGGEYFDAVQSAARAVNGYRAEGHSLADIIDVGNVDNDAVDRSVKEAGLTGCAAVNCD